MSVPASGMLVSAISGSQCDSQGSEEFFGHNLNARQVALYPPSFLSKKEKPPLTCELME